MQTGEFRFVSSDRRLELESVCMCRVRGGQVSATDHELVFQLMDARFTTRELGTCLVNLTAEQLELECVAVQLSCAKR